MTEVRVLGGAQTDWARNWLKEGRGIVDMLEEVVASTLESLTRHTDVVMLEAQLLGIEDLGAAYMASVEFSGLIREEPSSGPTPFREVWNMNKPKDGHSGWLVAGVQALQ